MTRQIQLPLKFDLPRGKGTVIQVEEKSIALFNVGDTFYAIDDSCPHAGASLANGKVEGHTVQCPAHGLRFDLPTGCMHYSTTMAVRSYPVTLNDGTITITLPNPETMDEST
jgi:3-phenylpropionate/trans-cinnamate dioxygenase ferredoxin subunit